MTNNKVHAAATEDYNHEQLTAGPNATDIQLNSFQTIRKTVNVASAPRRVRVRPIRWFSWATRQTLSIAISLSAILYVFISVPFRIGFLYNPFDPAENGDVNHWTWELSVFTPFDVIVDVVGAVEFITFYHVWKNGISNEVEDMDFERDLKLMRDTKGIVAPKNVNRRRATVGLRQGETKWTLGNLGRSSTMRDNGINSNGLRKQTLTKRNWEFALEVIAIIPLEIVACASGTLNALHLVRFNKLCRMYKLRRCFSRISKLYSGRPWIHQLSSSGINNLVRTIGLTAAICHWVSCGYMLIAHAQCGVSLQNCESRIESSWVVRDRLLGASTSRKYGRALYWGSRTMVLQGYDDVTPVSDAETAYVIIVQIVGALCSSSMLANFLFIFRFRNSRYSAFSTHVDNAREYMRSKGIPRVIRHQVIAYFNYAWNTHHGLDSEEALYLMPKHLQSKVIATLKATRIKQVSFLAKESVEFINSLALALDRRVYSPTDQIIEPKTNAQMYFVIRGSVVISAFDGSNPKDSQTGDFFAEICLLLPEQYEEKAIAKTFCELYVLSKVKFDEVVSHFYRGSEAAVVTQMAETLEKHSVQQRKTRKLLGHVSSVIALNRRNNHRRTVTRMKEDWNLPDSSFRLVWDTMHLMAVVYVAFEVPYHAVFVSMAEGENMFIQDPTIGLRYVCTLLAELFFVVDIVLRSRYLAYLDPIVMLNVVDPLLIFRKYREDGFFLDIIACIPVGIVVDSVSNLAPTGYSWLFRLPRLLRVRYLPGMVRDLGDAYSISSKLHMFISLLLGVALLLHVIGCIWFEMAWIPRDSQGRHGDEVVLRELTRYDCLRQASRFDNCSWVKFDCYTHVGVAFPAVDKASMYDNSFAYVRSVYWAVGTLTAVGYGDILAFSTAESYFAAVWIFVSGIINFGVVGAMSNTLSNIMAPRYQHLEHLNTLSSIMDRMSISEMLSAEIRRFYNQHFVGRKLAYESQLLANLPDQLCYQISSLLHSKAVKSVELFDSASIEFLQEVTGKFRHRSYENGETICLEGDVCRKFMVLLQNSRVNAFYRSRKVPVRALHEGDCYGVYEFLLRRAHSVTLVAASTVHASVMTRDQFDAIQRKFEDDLRDMKVEAQTFWNDEQTLLRRVARNLESLKLKPHVIQAPSLFYQRDSIVHTSTGPKLLRDLNDTRAQFTSVWTIGITFWNVYNAIFVIFRIGFHSHLRFSTGVSTAVWVADLWSDLYFAADIYLRLYYFGCSEVGFDNLIHRKKMDRVYRRSSNLKRDVFASLPLYVPMASGSLAVSLCRLPRLIRCLDLWVYLDDVIVQVQQHFASKNVSAYLRPAKLMIVVAFAAHFVGSIFLLSSDHECHVVAKCWMAQHRVMNTYGEDVWVIYGKAIHWAITTLLQISSPDIVPRDTIATIWTIVTCLACSFAMGYVVGEITDLIMVFGQDKKKYKSRVASFERFAKAHELSETLRKRVEYFFRFQFENTESDELTQLIHQLSANLRLKLMMEIYGHSLARLPISHFLSSSQINNLALRLQSELFIPGDNILVEQTLGNHLYILRKGLAAAFWMKSATSVALLLEGSLFGEVSFFLPKYRRLVTVRATTPCEVLNVSKHDWDELWAPTDDPSDVQVHKHALHSVFDWVSNRLHRYQQRSLYISRKARRELAARRDVANLNLSTKASGKEKSRIHGLPMALRRSSSLLFFANSVALPKVTPMQSVSVQTLERKAKYLLAKADVYMKQPHSNMIAAMPRKSATVTGRSSKNSVVKNLLHGTPNTATSLQIVGGDALVSSSKVSLTSNTQQFIIDLNPVNKHVRDFLGDEHVRSLEHDCWRRFKVMAAIQHSVHEILNALIPPETTTASVPANDQQQIKAKPAQNATSRRLQRVRSSLVDERELNKRGINNHKYQHGIRLRHKSSIGAELSVGESSITGKRRFTVTTGPLLIASKVAPKPVAQVAVGVKTTQLRRWRSLPLFGRKFFKIALREVTSNVDTNKDWTTGSSAGVDFEILQRCQRPQHESHIRLYHQYRAWVNNHQTKEGNKVQARHPSLGINLHVGTLRRINSKRDSRAIDPNDLQARNHALGVSDKDIKKFIQHIKKLGKIWSALMLVAAIYYVVVTPFKICFSHELTKLHSSTLRAWAGSELFLDMLCLLDVVYKGYDAFFARKTSSGSKRIGLRQILTRSPGLCADIMAVLPLEVLLIIPNVRISLEYEPSIESLWWTTRWGLRVNRMVFAWRIESLTEELLQYIIYEGNIRVRESLVSFLRALGSFIAMAHFLACVWFAVSYYAVQRYEKSWLSTSGMLAQITSSNFVESVSLGRKYLRSLLFSMECVTTILYGDIISMNRLELTAEMAITLFSIYVFAVFVGAQEELLNANAKREASFEQQLSELQLYLVQNEVPKKLKRHIKMYYAHVWSRSQGDSDFAEIEGVSSVLREDVVLAALHDFVVRVEVFRDLDESFLRALLVCLQYVVCSEGEDVVVAGDVDRSMYFIAQGTILVKIGSAEIPRERGEFFGALALLYGISRLETCVALTVTELYRLDHQPYERLLVEFPEYRARNKLAWVTATTPSLNRTILKRSLYGARVQTPNSSRALGFSENATAKDDANQIELELPSSYVYMSAMEMLARVQDLDPVEAKNIILRSRACGGQHIKARATGSLQRPHEREADLAIVPIQKSNEVCDDIVQRFGSHSRAPSIRNIVSHSMRLSELGDDTSPPGGMVSYRD